MSRSVLDDLVRLFARLPGLGPKSSRRLVCHLLKHRKTLMEPLSLGLGQAAQSIVICSSCGNLDNNNPCRMCTDERRQRHATLCIVEHVADLWALEQAGVHKGLYFILGATLSALDGVGPQDLRIDALIDLARRHACSEIILATNATVEGQTTSHYLTHRLSRENFKISRLAHGLPMGGELDYLDHATLSAAMEARSVLTPGPRVSPGVSPGVSGSTSSSVSPGVSPNISSSTSPSSDGEQP